MGQKKAGEAGEAIAPKKRRMKGNKDSKQMEGPNPSKSGEHELDNLGSKEEVEGSLQEGLLSKIKFPKVPKNLEDKDAELYFHIKTLEFMDSRKHELN
jgi:hypothetical protein